MAPTLIIVLGPPAVGKTAISTALARELGLPLISKDMLKETLGETLGCAELEQSRRLGRASMILLFRITEALLTAGQSCIIESAFHVELSSSDLQELQRRVSFMPLQIRCLCDPTVQRTRWEQRIANGQRHPVHMDTLRDVELAAHQREFLSLDGPQIDLDTTYLSSLAIAAIAAQIRSLAVL